MKIRSLFIATGAVALGVGISAIAAMWKATRDEDLAEVQQRKAQQVARDVAGQIAGGSTRIFGVMIESHLEAGAQKFTPGKDDPCQLAYGKSITDACLGWDDSVEALDVLSKAVAARRQR